MGDIKRPDKLVILGGDVSDVKILVDSMAITVTRDVHTDPMFSGVRIAVDSFIAGGPMEKVFYPFTLPERPLDGTLTPVTVQGGPFPFAKAAVGPYLPDYNEAVRYAKSRGVTNVMIAAIEQGPVPCPTDHYVPPDYCEVCTDEIPRGESRLRGKYRVCEACHSKNAYEFYKSVPERTDPEFEPHIGEWLKWAEEHPEQLLPLIVAAVRQSSRDQSKEFDGNMDHRIKKCDVSGCYRMVHDDNAHYIDAGMNEDKLRVCRFHAEVNDG